MKSSTFEPKRQNLTLNLLLIKSDGISEPKKLIVLLGLLNHNRHKAENSHKKKKIHNLKNGSVSTKQIFSDIHFEEINSNYGKIKRNQKKKLNGMSKLPLIKSRSDYEIQSEQVIKTNVHNLHEDDLHSTVLNEDLEEKIPILLIALNSDLNKRRKSKIQINNNERIYLSPNISHKIEEQSQQRIEELDKIDARHELDSNGFENIKNIGNNHLINSRTENRETYYQRNGFANKEESDLLLQETNQNNQKDNLQPFHGNHNDFHTFNPLFQMPTINENYRNHLNDGRVDKKIPLILFPLIYRINQ